MSAPYARAAVMRALAGGAWRDQPGRLVLAVLGIAFGVALGVAVHLVNASAANEFSLAVRALSGEADLVVRGGRSGFPDALYPALARKPEVRETSPAVEIEARIAGRRETVRIVGLDPFRAGVVQPHLLAQSGAALTGLIQGDGVLVSHDAAQHFGLEKGATLRVNAGSETLELRVLDVLPAGATRQRIALMDIALAQWRFGRLDTLNRIDLVLTPGTDVETFRKALASELPAGVQVTTPEVEAGRSASFTRAYRTNLDMLALVALFTGAFLVFSTQFLSLLRRRAQLALLRVIGLTRGRLLRLLIAEGAVTGIVGSLAGVALGVALASFGVERLGGDLGAGYYSAQSPVLTVSPGALAFYFALGVGFSILGAAVPALEAARRPPARALKAGDEEAALGRYAYSGPGVIVFVLGLAASQAPPVHELPLFGYLSVALILVGAILLLPRLTEAALARLPEVCYAPAALAAAQLQATPRQVAIGLAAILTSFSLMVSMLIMIGSFRTSLEAWLDRMLPADVYVRAISVGDGGSFTPEEEARLAQLPGVREAVFLRSLSVLLREDRPPMTLLARPFRDGRPHPALPVEGVEKLPREDAPPAVWVSEIASDLLGARVGATIELPMGGAWHRFTVAGIWRDYARQNGALVIDRGLYVRLTGDRRATDAALYLEPGTSYEEAALRVRSVFRDPDAVEIASTRELKTLSLSIFDRTFAVTYALEIAAILIGLFGVSASFSAQALARRREFGVLRHLGMRRREIAAMLAAEGLAVGSLGVAAGCALGWLISLILIHVINRQSFHWSMDMAIPWQTLAALGATLVAAATLTAVLSGRRAMGVEVTRAVREDW